MSKTNYFIIFSKGIFVSIIGTFILGILNYLVRRQLALSLSIQDFGFLYSAFSLCSIILSYIDLGISQSSTILISKSLLQKSKELMNIYFLQSLIIKLLLSIIIYLFLCLSYKFWIDIFFNYKAVIPFFIIMSLLIFQAISGAPSSVVVALKKFGISYTGQIINPVVVLSVLFFNCNLLFASIAFPLSAFLIFLFYTLFIYYNGHFQRINNHKKLLNINPLFHLSKWIAISTLGLTSMYYMDSLMLTWFDTLESVGLYNVALPIMQLAQILLIISSVFLPIVSEMWASKRKEEIGRIVSFISEFILYIFWPIAVFISLFSKYLIIFLFSSKFTEASTSLVILFLGNIFYTLANFYMGVLNAEKSAKIVAISIICSAGLNIFLNYILIPFFSINGAALATALSYLFNSAFLFLVLKKILGQKFKLNIKFLLYSGITGLFTLISILLFTKNYYPTLWHTITFFIILISLYVLLTCKLLFRYFNFIKPVVLAKYKK